MMYKILNRLFGWDYIQWSNTADCGIARVHKAGDGKVFYWRYKTTELADIIKKKEDVLWLTCDSNKYFGEEL